MKTPRKSRTLYISSAAVLAAGLFLAGCSADTSQDDATPTPTVEQDVSSTPAVDPTDTTTPQTADQDATEPVGDFTTGEQQPANWPDFGDAKGVYPVDVRTGQHDGFERIVIDHAGTGIPSFMAHYTADPSQPGSGQPVDTGDAAYLEVIVSGTASIDDLDVDKMLDNGAVITDLDTAAVGTVVSYAPWEATSSYFIGLDEERPYAVKILDDPVRVIIDVETD